MKISQSQNAHNLLRARRIQRGKLKNMNDHAYYPVIEIKGCHWLLFYCTIHMLSNIMLYFPLFRKQVHKSIKSQGKPRFVLLVAGQAKYRSLCWKRDMTFSTEIKFISNSSQKRSHVHTVKVNRYLFILVLYKKSSMTLKSTSLHHTRIFRKSPKLKLYIRDARHVHLH